MTIKEVLDYVDRIKKNDFTAAEKTRWINEIEGYVQIQIMLLAQPECVSYYHSSESDVSGITFPASNQMLLPRKLKVHVGGLLSVEGLVSYPKNNLSDLEILSISDGGKLLEFAEGTFNDTGTTPESAIAQLTFDGQETELLVPAPFERLYYEYVLCKISENLEESSAQNNRIATFEETWENFAEWYANNYNPADGNAEFKGYYITGMRGPAGPVGPRGENIYTVTVTKDGDVISADKTYADICANIDAGKGVTLVTDGVTCAVSAIKQDGLLVLSAAIKSEGKPKIAGYTVSAADVWTAVSDELALQSQLSSYRTAADQDAIDATKQKKLTAGDNIDISEDGTISATNSGAEVFTFDLFVLSETEISASKTYAEIKAAIDAGSVVYITDNDDVIYAPQIAMADTSIEMLWLDNRGGSTYRWSAIVNSENVWSVSAPTLVTSSELSARLNGKQDKLIAGENIIIAEDGKTISATGGLGYLPVKLTDFQGDGSVFTCTADKTFDEVEAATSDGKALMSVDMPDGFAMCALAESGTSAATGKRWMEFVGRYIEHYIVNIRVYSDDSWELQLSDYTTSDELSAVQQRIGLLSNLATTDKSTVVAAINEVKSDIPTKTSQLENDSGFVSDEDAVEAETINVPSKLSDLTNDAGYLTLDTLPKYDGGVSAT